VVTHQLQVERRTAKAHQPKTNALPLDYATNRVCNSDMMHYPQFLAADASNKNKYLLCQRPQVEQMEVISLDLFTHCDPAQQPVTQETPVKW